MNPPMRQATADKKGSLVQYTMCRIDNDYEELVNARKYIVRYLHPPFLLSTPKKSERRQLRPCCAMHAMPNI